MSQVVVAFLMFIFCFAFYMGLNIFSNLCQHKNPIGNGVYFAEEMYEEFFFSWETSKQLLKSDGYKTYVKL